MLKGWGLPERPLTGPWRAPLACLPPLSTLLPEIKPLQLIFSSCVRYTLISSLSLDDSRFFISGGFYEDRISLCFCHAQEQFVLLTLLNI